MFDFISDNLFIFIIISIGIAGWLLLESISD